MNEVPHKLSNGKGNEEILVKSRNPVHTLSSAHLPRSILQKSLGPSLILKLKKSCL